MQGRQVLLTHSSIINSKDIICMKKNLMFAIVVASVVAFAGNVFAQGTPSMQDVKKAAETQKEAVKGAAQEKAAEVKTAATEKAAAAKESAMKKLEGSAPAQEKAAEVKKEATSTAAGSNMSSDKPAVKKPHKKHHKKSAAQTSTEQKPAEVK
jgi:hypothetical protein